MQPEQDGLGGDPNRTRRCPGRHAIRARLWACIVAAVLMALAGRPGAAQLPAIPDAETAARQEHHWLAHESTAALVPYPVPLPNLKRWTIDTRLHRGDVGVAALAPDATRIATGNVDGVLRVWNLTSGQLEHAVMAHRWSIGIVAWSPNGDMVATNSRSDATVRVFDAKTWRTMAELPGLFDILVWSPDSSRLAGSRGHSGGIFISTGLGKFSLLKEIGRHVSALAWNSDGRLAVAAASNGVMIIESKDGRQRFVLEDTEPLVMGMLAWSPDGGHLATVGPASAAVFETSAGKRVQELGKSGRRVAWSADSKQVAVYDGTGVSLFPFPTEDRKPRRLKIPASRHLTWSPDSTRLFAVSERQVQSWDPAGDAAERDFSVSGGSEPPLAEPGRPLVAGLGTPHVTLWDPARIRLTRRLDGQGPATTVAAWSPTTKVLAIGDTTGSVRTWDAGSDQHAAAGPPLSGAATLLAWSGDGKALAAAGSSGPVPVWWPATGETKILDGHKGRVSALAWGATSSRLATAAADEKILIWDVAAGSVTKTIAECGRASALAWERSPTLAVGLAENGLSLFNPGTGEPVQELIPRTRRGFRPISGLASIPGGPTRLLFGWRDWHTVHAIDAATKVRFQRQLAPDGCVWAAVLSNGLAVTASNDRTVRYWNLVNGKLAGFVVDDGGSIAAVSAAGDVAFDPDSPPDLIAIVDRGDRQEWMTLDAFAKAHRWKNNPKSIRLPTKK